MVEPQRSQYLEAMGLTAWVSRYRLPNAAPTRECEWLEEPGAAPSSAPAQRLQALLDDAQRPPVAPNPTPAQPTVSSPSRQARRARGLLEPDGAAAEPPAPALPVAAAADAAPSVPQVALRFTLQIAALEGRWLILLPGSSALDATAQRLLASLLHAAGIVSDATPAFQTFSWPIMEGLPVEAPLEEARDGLRAFVEGRRGWRPERLLVFGESDVLAPVLELKAGHCHLLAIAGWQGPSMQTLMQSAEAKRELWPRLVEWRQAWHRAAGGSDTQGDDVPAPDAPDS